MFGFEKKYDPAKSKEFDARIDEAKGNIDALGRLPGTRGNMDYYDQHAGIEEAFIKEQEGYLNEQKSLGRDEAIRLEIEYKKLLEEARQANEKLEKFRREKLGAKKDTGTASPEAKAA